MEVTYLPERVRRSWQAELAGIQFPVEADAAWRAFEALSVELAQRHLPAETLETLARLPETRDILVLQNLPLDSPVLEPPRDNFRPLGKPAVSEAVHLGIVRLLAQVFGFEEEEEGALFHQIAPKLGREDSQSNGGIVPFKPHSDDAFLFREHRPEFLSLFGLLNERSAPTWLFPVEEILAQLDSKIIDRLQRPDFIHAPPTSFLTGGVEIPATTHPVAEHSADGWEVSFNSVRTSAFTPDAEAALNAFREALQRAPHSEVVIGPGTLVIFSNLRHLHGRGAIRGKRWLQRLYSRRDLSALRAASGVAEPALIFSAARLVAGYTSLVS
jgi:L-asparagine oxygenase